jgi:pilus assembly protein Flp/PilA
MDDVLAAKPRHHQSSKLFKFGRPLDLDGLCRQSLKPLKESPMRGLYKKMVSFLKQEDGPTAVEYAVMLSLIIVVCIVAITSIGSNANLAFSAVGSSIKG